MPKTIQVRDVPDDVHHRLTVQAAQQRLSLSELVRAELVAAARRPTMAEMLDRLAARPAVEPPETAADAIRRERPGSLGVIVVDASAVVELLLNTPRAAGVRQVLSRVREAHAPELLEPEALGAVRRWLARGWIASEAAEQAVREMGELALVRHGHAPLRARVWALRDRCSTYQACYVALAEALDARLLTADVRLSRAAAGLVAVIPAGGE
jgi:predicted nucleic acid-binding protein/plasmid stability protein